MLSVEEALHQIIAHKGNPGTEKVPLLQAVDRVLAQEVTADRDLPPFDRVTMDGIALRAEEFRAGRRSFPVEHIQAAGALPVTLQNLGACVEVMTGAMLPNGTTAVVPYEQCTIQNEVATVQTEQVLDGQNIHLQGADGKAGAVLISAGVRISPAIIGVMASVGLSVVEVYRLPRVAVCSTGDELVDIEQIPLAYQIRKSNVYQLAAALQQEKITANLYHLPDEPEQMRLQLSSILQEHDAVLLSGAVSKGKFDFLPQVLEELGLKQVFHKIAQKPGKPMLFGTLPGGKVVFGLPGNPVSTFVCYHLYFKPWLRATLQLPQESKFAQLAQEITFQPSLAYHLPVTLNSENGVLTASPVSSSGSGDMTSLLLADALLSLPPEGNTYAVGEAFPITLL